VAVGEKQPITSYHLNLLKRSGILEAEKRGKWMYYRIRTPKVISLIENADEINYLSIRKDEEDRMFLREG